MNLARNAPSHRTSENKQQQEISKRASSFESKFKLSCGLGLVLCETDYLQGLGKILMLTTLVAASQVYTCHKTVENDLRQSTDNLGLGL
tara:strand:+ start:531 stop:797 length:267 start_codon:yes stop_codon:yes gene_type:complete